jgi:hypothetical protein
VPGDVAASLKEGCTGAFGTARDAAGAGAASRETKPSAPSTVATTPTRAKAGAASGDDDEDRGGSDGEDRGADEGAAGSSSFGIASVLAVQCPLFLSSGSSVAVAGSSSSSSGPLAASACRPFAATGLLRRLTEHAFSGGTFRLRPAAERLAAWFALPSTTDAKGVKGPEEAVVPRQPPAVAQAGVAFTKVASLLQVRDRTALCQADVPFLTLVTYVLFSLCHLL